MWEAIGKGREPMPFEQDYFLERDFVGVTGASGRITLMRAAITGNPPAT